MKFVGYTKDGNPVFQISRNKYGPHQSRRERRRRLKQMIKGQLPQAAPMPDLIAEYLKP